MPKKPNPAADFDTGISAAPPSVGSRPAPVVAPAPVTQTPAAKPKLIPAETAAQKKAETEAATKKKAEAFRAQQGLPAVTMSPDVLAKRRKKENELLRQCRLEMLARTNRDVAWLLAQVKAKPAGAAS